MNKAAVRIAAILLGLLIAIAFLIPNENHYDRSARIGASDDLSGLVLDYMQRSGKYPISEYIEPYFIRDC